MTQSFIVLETKIVAGEIQIYGGLLPAKGEFITDTVAHFRWYKLSVFNLQPQTDKQQWP